MHPILFQTPFFALHTYGVFTALAFLLGALYALRWARVWGLNPAVLSDAIAWLVVGGLLGARLLYVMSHETEFSGDLLSVFKIWQGGLMWHGGLLGGAAAGAFFFHRRRVPLSLAGDILSPGLALGQAIGRLGCFFAGCCYGRRCDLPWAVTFSDPQSLAPTGVPLHPSQLYDVGFNLAVVAALGLAARTPSFRPGRGRLFFLYLALASLARFAMEFTRDDNRGLIGAITVTQAVSAALLTLAIFGLIRRRTA